MTTFRNVKTRSTKDLKKDLRTYQGIVLHYDQLISEAQAKMDSTEDPKVVRDAEFEMDVCAGYQEDTEAYIKKIKAELKSR